MENADKTRRAGLTTSQRNKVCPVTTLVVVMMVEVAAPENLGKLEVFPGPDSSGRTGGVKHDDGDTRGRMSVVAIL